MLAGLIPISKATQCFVSEIHLIDIPPHPIPLPAGERGRVRGNHLEFLNKYAENLFAMVPNEPQHLLNEFLRHDTRGVFVFVN